MDSVYMTVVILAGILLVITRWLKSLILQQDYNDPGEQPEPEGAT